jgi:RNA polymerase sigma-70 factor (ECF subfamily)
MTGKDRTDNELVKEFKAGSRDVFDILIERHSSRMYQAAYGLISNREDAEEVVQDAFVRAYKGLDKFREDASFQTWLYRIVTNLSRNKYQWNKRRGAELNVTLTRKAYDPEKNEGEEMNLPDNSMKPDAVIEGAELEEDLIKSMERLPGSIREAMILRHVNEFPYDKIAELLNCRVGTVKSRIARGREVLRKIINPA